MVWTHSKCPWNARRNKTWCAPCKMIGCQSSHSVTRGPRRYCRLSRSTAQVEFEDCCVAPDEIASFVISPEVVRRWACKRESWLSLSGSVGQNFGIGTHWQPEPAESALNFLRNVPETLLWCRLKAIIWSTAFSISLVTTLKYLFLLLILSSLRAGGTCTTQEHARCPHCGE